jgi:hypothetical protein
MSVVVTTHPTSLDIILKVQTRYPKKFEPSIKLQFVLEADRIMNISLRTLVVSWVCLSVSAWTTPLSPTSEGNPATTTASRRDWLQRIAVVGSAVVAGVSSSPQYTWAAFDTEKALQELEQSVEKMKPIPE